MTNASNKESLQKIADAGHQIVMAKPDMARVAIPYLLFLSAHPNNLSRYQHLLNDKNTLGKRLYNTAAKAALTARSLKASLKASFQASLIQNPQEIAGDPLEGDVDILFISHFLRPSDATQSADLYYGTIPAELEAQGVKTHTALLNHAKTPWSEIKHIWQTNAATRSILPAILHPKSENNLNSELQNTINDLKIEQALDDNEFRKAVRAHAIIDAASPSARTAMRIGKQVQYLVEKLNPKILITTYEGHSWERLAFANARKIKPEIKCVGYHHAVLFPMQQAMLTPIGSPYDPDLILTAGEITRDYFDKNSKFTNIPVKTLGSCRGAKDDQLADSPVTQNHCLILPEGLVSESLSLSKFAIRAAKLNPATTFTIRLHPLITPKMLAKADAEMKSLPGNVSWSNKSLEDDCKAARWALYRGSSAIITAVLHGVQPLYLAEEPEELQIDPIKTMPLWRATISTPDEFSLCISQDLSKSDEDRKAEFLSARKYCQDYFSKPTPDLLISLLKS